MANIVNQYGQVKLGVRAPLTSTLWGNVFGVWNADTTSTVTTLGTGTFAAWNAEDIITATQLGTNISGVWNGEASNSITVKNAWNANGDAVDSKGTANGTIVTPNSTTGYATSSMTYSTGKLGTSCFTFNGSNFVSLPNNTFTFTSDFTVSLWFYVPSNYASNSSLVSAFDNQSSFPTYFGWWISYGSTNKNIGFSIGDSTQGSYGNVTLSTANNTITPGQWNHVVVTRKNGNRSRIYINGVLSNSNTNTVNPRYGNNTEKSSIGSSYFAFSQPFWTAANAGLKIDALQTWESELDQEVITELYNSGNGQEYPFTLSNALIPTYNDSVGFKHGILPSSTLTNGVPGPSFTTGKIGQAFNFDGVNDYIQLPNNSMNFLGDFSISLWVNFNGSNGTLIGSTGFGNNSSPQEGTSGWSLTYSNGYLTFNIYNDNSYSGLEKNNVIVSNAWNHIVITSKSGSNKIYANGVLVISNTSTMRPNYRKTVSTRLGGSSTYLPNSYFFGKMDAVTAWEKELSASEISALYNSGNAQQYPFSDVTLSGVTSDALGSYNGTNNGVTFTTGKTGTSSFSFNGSSNYIALPQAALNFNKGNSGQSIGDFSVSFWLNLNTGSSDYQTVIGNWGDNGRGWQVVMFGGGFTFFGSDGSNGSTARIQHSLGLSQTNATNQWVHVVVTYTNQSQVNSYVNGVLTNTTSTTYQIRTNERNNGNLGCYPQSGDNSSTKYWFLNGKLDAVTLWTKALTNTEASALYNNGTGYQYSFPSSATGYLSSYNDVIGTNHGTLTNGCRFTAGKIGQAFLFDGVNDYVALPNNIMKFSNTDNWSISFWIYATVTGVSGVIGNWDYSGGQSTGWGIRTGGTAGGDPSKFTIQFFTNFVNGSGNLLNPLATDGTTSINTWNHFVITRNSSAQEKIYQNGTLVTSQTNSSTKLIYPATSYSCIGAERYQSNVVNYAKAGSKIDAMSVWTKELTAEEVTSLYNSGNGKQYPTT
jgi:hypothetical protein